MEYHSKQGQIIKSKARFKVIRAGRRSGKSAIGIEIMLLTATHRKNRNVFYLAPTQKQSRSIIWEAIKARIGGAGEVNEGIMEI